MGNRRLRGESGAIVVLAAAGMVGLLIVLAIVVDLGYVRDERRAHQSAVDFAALAAGDALGWEPAPDGQAGCTSAVKYLQANVADLPGTGLAVPCNSLPATCSGSSSPVTVTDGGTAGRYDIEITFPVSDTMISDPTVTGGLRNNDGLPCERIMVRLVSSADSFFGAVIGTDSLEIDAQAVVRQVPSSDLRIPSFWLLEPYDCDGLTVSGGSVVTSGSSLVPGLITLDSSGDPAEGDCGGQKTTIDTDSNSTLQAIGPALPVPPKIQLFAMNPSDTTCLSPPEHACDAADVASGSLSPQPVPRAKRATRAPVDHKYNCKSAYPTYFSIPIAGCSEGTPAHIDDLRAAIGSAGTPLGFQTWSDSYGCTDPTVPAGGLSGNWHIDCPANPGGQGGGFKLTGGTVTFNDGNIVFDGPINLQGGTVEFNQSNTTATLSPTCLLTIVACIDQSSAGAAWVYQRAGDLSLSGGGGFNATQTAIYQHYGFFSIAGGSPPNWTSPTEGPLAGLAIWSEKPDTGYKISGGAALLLQGAFFTPYGTMDISGGSPVSPLEAQFVARKLKVTGGASIQLQPDPDQSVSIPPAEPLLIR